MAATFALAVVGAHVFAAPAEPFALVLAAAGVLLRRRTHALAPTAILAVLALSLAIVQPAAEVDFRLHGSRIAAGLRHLARRSLLVASQHAPSRQPAQGRGR